MDNIQYPVTGSSGWGTKINNNFKEISDTIGTIDKDSKGDIGTQLGNIDTQLKESKKPKYRGTNMYLDDGFSHSSIDNYVTFYKDININAILIAFDLKINSDWSITPKLGKEQLEYSCSKLHENHILPKGIKVHFKFDTSLTKTELGGNFISDYKTLINDYMNIVSNYGGDTVLILNEMNVLTSYLNNSTVLNKIKDLVSYTKGLGYKVSMSMNFPQIQQIDDEILDMLDIICFNTYPSISDIGLKQTKDVAVSVLNNDLFSKMVIEKAKNKEVWISETGCLDHELSLSAPEITGSVVESEPMCNGNAKAFFYDCFLEWFTSQNRINAVFFWDGVTEFRPYETVCRDVIKKYWKVSDKLC